MLKQKPAKTGKTSKLSQGFYFFRLIKQLTIILFLFFAARLLFYIFNRQSFSDCATLDLFIGFLYGIRFDISAILYFNILFILILLVPHPYREKKGYRIISSFIFYFFNGIALLLTVIDFEYFKFAKKRMTFDLISMKSDLNSLVPEYLKDYWYLALILVSFLVISWYISKKMISKTSPPKINYFIQSIILIFTIGLFLIGVRGGFQLKPLKVLDASLYGTPKTVPLILNSPFTFIQSYGRKRLTEIRYMSNEIAEKRFPIYHRVNSEYQMKKMNVVIIIVESLSREFMSCYGAEKSYTPFLDSLATHSLVCKNSFANGTRSMEAIPAVIASIPHLMTDSYIYSAYQGNRINSIGSLLDEKEYETAFFHGGTNGTMGFDSFVKMGGIKKYFGRSEYGDEKDFDGLWGIYDEEFLQFTAQTLEKMKKPFCSTIFTLSSHEPISIPQKYKDKFERGKLPIERGIEYVDFAIGKFFHSVSKMEWYQNTLFVITGDHTPGRTQHQWFQSSIGMFEVPIMFFAPNNKLKGMNNKLTSHVDIMPSILDYLSYGGDYVSFGRSIFDSSYDGSNLNLVSESYQLLKNDYALLSDGEKVISFEKYSNEKKISQNHLGSDPAVEKKMLENLRASLQIYRNAMIHDRLTTNSYHNYTSP
ncbi:MAG: sulfatase-like hydrolase/transferase [Ignavibacteriales bacterium]|nr:sulfatase-like hydrolase/transferase [Ignavibacteriales bacterium]